jgi:hypothetical protein
VKPSFLAAAVTLLQPEPGVRGRRKQMDSKALINPANAEQVRDVNEVAGVPFARIVAATELAVAQSGPSSEGGSA